MAGSAPADHEPVAHSTSRGPDRVRLLIATVLANVVNNLPALLILLAALMAAGEVAVLIGVNIGPNLTYPGSLSNAAVEESARTS